MTNAVLISAEDTVVTVMEAIPKCSAVTYRFGGKENTVYAASDIPRYHKLAIRSISRGSTVRKYGEHIGFATANIAVGEHVHTQNLDSSFEEVCK